MENNNKELNGVKKMIADGIVTQEAAEKYFPELKESEDERIRKALIRFHKSTIDVDGIKGEDILAWLEKQGEQKPADTWKPSDEQVKELEFFISDLPKCSVTAQKIVKKGKDTLVSLLSDLKKLKEE